MRQAAAISAEAPLKLMKHTKAASVNALYHGLFIKEVHDRGAFGEAYGASCLGQTRPLCITFNDGILQQGNCC